MSEKTVVTQPRPYIMNSGSGQWTSNICDCLDDLPQCCLAFWCLPCFECKTAHEAGECVCLPLLDGFGLIPPIGTSLRVSIRQRHGIEGTICNDCVRLLLRALQLVSNCTRDQNKGKSHHLRQYGVLSNTTQCLCGMSLSN